ncbi:MAG: hypothetical protein F6K42_07850 [Leptolyngbya sp. SIO1D8]|nr:hypothetical protein [Leptolyngbya sp. SIO1D8]
MFHLYFGAFDIVLYLGAAYFATVLANAICDNLEQPKVTQVQNTSAAAARPVTVVSLPKREVVKETVSVRVGG